MLFKTEGGDSLNGLCIYFLFMLTKAYYRHICLYPTKPYWLAVFPTFQLLVSVSMFYPVCSVLTCVNLLSRILVAVFKQTINGL